MPKTAGGGVGAADFCGTFLPCRRSDFDRVRFVDILKENFMPRLFKLAFALFAGFWLASGAQAQSWKPEMIARAADALEVCFNLMPDSRATKDELKAQGFRYEGADDRYHYYSLNGRRIIIGTTVTHERRQGCLVSVSKMTPQEASSIAAPMVEKARGRPLQPQNRNVSGAWVGTLNGRGVAIASLKELDFGLMRGAAVIILNE